MGLFDRRKQITAEQKSEASRALAEWGSAQTLAAWRNAFQRLARLGDWGWWLALARAAESDSNYELVGQVACFTTQSKSVLRGEAGFSPPSRSICKSVDEIAIRCLGGAPSNLVIQDGSAGPIDIETLLKWATARVANDLY